MIVSEMNKYSMMSNNVSVRVLHVHLYGDSCMLEASRKMGNQV